MKELLEYLARGLVEHPEEVRVNEVQEDGVTLLELSVAEDDYGNVIGRGGRHRLKQKRGQAGNMRRCHTRTIE